MRKIAYLICLILFVGTANAQVGGRCLVCPPSLQGVPDGYVLTDSSGYARWQAAGGGSDSAAWALTGNSGTTAGTNFIGTTDNVDLIFKVAGVFSGWIDTGGSNTSIGMRALYSNTSGIANTAFGIQALTLNTTGSQNSAFGSALSSNVTGSYNSAFSLSLENSTGSRNSAFGHKTFSQVTTGNDNTAIGTWAGNRLTTGSYNTFIGDSSNAVSTSANRSGAWGYNAIVGRDSSYVIGDTTATYVGIRTAYPQAALDVHGNVKVVDGTQGVGKVFTSDADGNATWQTLAGASGTGIPAYANNAAAFAAIGAGKLYYTDVAGEYVLKLSH